MAGPTTLYVTITDSVIIRTTDDGVHTPFRAEGLSTTRSPPRDAPLPPLPPLNRNLPLHILHSTGSPPADPCERRASYSYTLPRLRNREGDRRRGRRPWRRLACGSGVRTHRQGPEPAGGRRPLVLAIARRVLARHVALFSHQPSSDATRAQPTANAENFFGLMPAHTTLTQLRKVTPQHSIRQ